MWCYGFRRLGGPHELEELERRRHPKLKIESISVNDGTVTLYIRNLGYKFGYGSTNIRLLEILDKPSEQKHLFGLITTIKRSDTLISYKLLKLPAEEIKEITLRPKNRKLQMGHRYRIVISTEHETHSYNFTINESGNAILTCPSSD